MSRATEATRILQSAADSLQGNHHLQHRIAVSQDLPGLFAAWTELEARAAATAFQSHAWCSAWAAAVAGQRRSETPYIVTIFEGERLVLVWPLAVRWIGPFRVLVSFGDPATQCSDALVEPGMRQGLLLEAAWAEVAARRNAHALFIKGVRSDAAIAGMAVLRDDAWVTRVDAAPFADFRSRAQTGPTSQTGPAGARSGRSRNALQRHLRNLAKHGPVTFEMIDGPAARVAAIREVLELKRAWIIRKAQFSAGYSHPANAGFLQTLAAREDFIIARLAVAGKTAALEAGVLRGGRYWSLAQSYDARYALHGPGRLLIWHMIQRAASLGVEVLDFLAPAFPHKCEWSNGETPVRDYVIPLRPGGHAITLYFRHIRPRLKVLLVRWYRTNTGPGAAPKPAGTGLRSRRSRRPRSRPGAVQ